MSKTPEILIPALRQYRHNFGSEAFIVGYDEIETRKIVEQLQKENAELKRCIGVDADASLNDTLIKFNVLLTRADMYLRWCSYAEYSRYKDGDEDASVYFWNPDEENRLESLVNSVAVVIRADDLRHLLTPEGGA